jgi:hypothetical protein
VCAFHDSGGHIQIAQQSGGGSCLFRFPLCFEEQLGMLQNAFAGDRPGFAPGGIELAGLPRIASMLGKDGSHAQAIVQADAGRGHQKLHGYLRRDLAGAHLLLDTLREKLYQSQAPRNPTGAAVKALRQLFQSVAEAMLQLS